MARQSVWTGFVAGAALAAVVFVAGAAVRPSDGSPVAGMQEPHGEWVAYAGAGGDSVRAYVVYPERSDPAPGVIVIHEIYGMSDWIQAVADTFAMRGYVAIAPDLLTRRGGTANIEEPRRAIGSLPPDSIGVDLDATFAYLDGLPAVRNADIGVIGFCWGGSQSFRYATRNPNLKAAIVCYGGAPDAEVMASIRAPVFGVYAEDDARINAGIPDAEAAMERHGKTYRTTIYEGVGHAFLRRGPPEVAARAWSDVFQFLGEQTGR